MKQFHHYSIITPFRIKLKVYFAVAWLLYNISCLVCVFMEEYHQKPV